MPNRYDTAAEAFSHMMQHLQTMSEAKTVDSYAKALERAIDDHDEFGVHLCALFNDCTKVDNPGMPIVHAITHDADSGRFDFEVEL